MLLHTGTSQWNQKMDSTSKSQLGEPGLPLPGTVRYLDKAHRIGQTGLTLVGQRSIVALCSKHRGHLGAQNHCCMG